MKIILDDIEFKLSDIKSLIRCNYGLTKSEIARRIAFNTHDLFPVDCIDILKEIYGKRLDSMKPKTIFKIVHTMLSCHGEPDPEYINEAIQNFCNS